MANERLQVVLELVTGQYKREAREAATATGQIAASAGVASGGVNRMGVAVGRLGGVLAGVFAVDKLLEFTNETIDAASRLEEAINAVEVVFGQAGPTIREFGETAATAAGLAESEFLQMSTILGSALQNAGMSAQEAAESTIILTQRAADMASVFNTDVATALGAIQAALRGEIDPIEKFGVALTAAAVEARAVELGFSRVEGEFDAAAKAAARLSLILEQTNGVAGDFANTSDSLANNQRILAAEFENTKAELGNALLPVMNELLELVRELSPTLVEGAKGFTEIVAAAKPLIDLLTELVKVYNSVKGAIDSASESGNRFISTIGKMGQGLFQGGLTTFIKGVQSVVSAVSGTRGSGVRQRAIGGLVNPGEAYLVGERGPELLIPSQSGSILSNQQMRGWAQNITRHGPTIVMQGPTQNFQQDLQYATILASIQTLVEG